MIRSITDALLRNADEWLRAKGLYFGSRTVASTIPIPHGTLTVFFLSFIRRTAMTPVAAGNDRVTGKRLFDQWLLFSFVHVILKFDFQDPMLRVFRRQDRSKGRLQVLTPRAQFLGERKNEKISIELLLITYYLEREYYIFIYLIILLINIIMLHL
jgi:hypothetical protein